MVKTLRKVAVWIFMVTGAITFLFVLLSFTHIPYKAYYELGSPESTLFNEPDVIVLLGGAGMPSPDGLIRCYYAAENAMKYDSAIVIIALPENDEDSVSQLDMMALELVMRGVDSARIDFEPNGYNTFSQASNIAGMFEGKKNDTGLLIITSPEHTSRAVKVFRKAGFEQIGSAMALEKSVAPEELKKEFDDNRTQLNFRYNMWSYMHYELFVLREYIATSYYKLRGWI